MANYFLRVKAETPTRLWINNPTLAEVGAAIRVGAVGCTTNPTFSASLLRRTPDVVRDAIDGALETSSDDTLVASIVQRRLAASTASEFMPLFEESSGREGLVSIQGSPLADDDGRTILAEALRNRALAPNLTPKLPATVPGFEAMAPLVEAGSPVIVTEVFSVAQLIHACELYERVAGRDRPPFFISPITGIFGDHLRTIPAQGGATVSARSLDLAGVALARACNRIVESRGYSVTLLFGGARTVDDYIGLVGSRVASTVNYSTVEEILAVDPPVKDSIHEPLPVSVTDELGRAFPDFRRAMIVDGLADEEFEEFGPVQHFRSRFVDGWQQLLSAIHERRALALL